MDGDSGLVVVTPPVREPLTLTEAKEHVRVEDAFTADDSYITALITAARQRVEYETGRAMIDTVYRYTLPAFPVGPVELPRGPVVSLTTFEYTDADGATQLLVSGTDYEIADGRLPPQLATLDVWPATLVSLNAVRVTYKAGYGTSASAVPAPLRQAMLLMLGSWYENRQLFITGRFGLMPLSAEWLMAPYMSGRY